ncbi:tRNA pseudouridine(38-40) synthase TruA [soil metagenome]
MTLFEPPEAPPAPPAGPVVRVRLAVAYDGSGFRGFAENRGLRTVGLVLREAIERMLGHAVALTCAGRTDAGVHAWGQVVTFDARPDGLDPGELARSLNRMLAPAVAVREAAVAPDGFDARHSATARCYRYTIVNRDVPDPFQAATAWLVAEPLDLAALRLACDPLIGLHDFAAFCRRPKGGASGAEPTLERRVLDARWLDLGDGVLRFEISASSFCHQMVRSVVGTLVDAGRGHRRPGDVAAILRSRDRRYASDLAPAHGLCLWSVHYDGWSS